MHISRKATVEDLVKVTGGSGIKTRTSNPHFCFRYWEIGSLGDSEKLEENQTYLSKTTIYQNNENCMRKNLKVKNFANFA